MSCSEGSGELTAPAPAVGIGDPDRLSQAVEEPRRADAETVAYFDRVIAATGTHAGDMRPADVVELPASAR